MNSSEKILKLISNFIESGILTSQDAKKELIDNLKFKRDDLINNGCWFQEKNLIFLKSY